ncbi:MAG: hypothetical protein JSS01_04020 [Proteobacteria bacterium]|nr:hypothetical protein [Pseudomonadota bacterium]
MSSLDDTLSAIETQLLDMQAALLSSDPQSLEQTAGELRQAATTLAQALASNLVPPGAGERVQAIAQQLGLLRNQLARVLALTERQAASLLPPMQGVTYGPSTGAQGPRIYRAPG